MLCWTLEERVGMDGKHAAESCLGKGQTHLQSSKHSTVGNNLHLMLKKTFFPGNPLLLQSIFGEVAAFKKYLH